MVDYVLDAFRFVVDAFDLLGFINKRFLRTQQHPLHTWRKLEPLYALEGLTVLELNHVFVPVPFHHQNRELHISSAFCYHPVFVAILLLFQKPIFIIFRQFINILLPLLQNLGVKSLDQHVP